MERLMNKLIIRIFLIFNILTVIILGSEVKLSIFDELEPLYPDTEISNEDTLITLHVAKNSIAGFHLLVKNLGKTDILRIYPKTDREIGNCEIFHLIDVPVEINTGIESRTEKWDNKINPYVIRRAPFDIYEAMQPINSPFFTSNKIEAFRIQWRIPCNIKSGKYEIPMVMETLNCKRNLNIIIDIYDVKIPDLSEKSYGYTNWFSIKNIADRHNLILWSESFWEMLKKYADMMAYGRQNMFFVPLNELVKVKNNEPILDTIKMKRYIDTFKDAGLDKIEFTHFAHRTNQDWSSKTLSSSFNKSMLVNSPEGVIFYKKLFEQLQQIIIKNGWENQSCFHVSDEPTDALADDYIKFVEYFHEYFPKAKILEATMTEKLVGAVDIWTPQLQEYQGHSEFFDDLKNNGSEIWVYSCLVPGGKWLNRLLDQEKLREVYIGWSLPYYNLDGFLHWGLNHYHVKNPFVQSVVDHPHAPNTNNQLPAGDTHILYPGIDGPMSSIRFEAHRIGMEDAELLRLLKIKNKRKFKKITKKVFRAFDDYEVSVEEYRRVKIELLKALE